MKTQIKSFVFLAVGITLIMSCQKAGIDGSATLVIFPQHHGVTIANHIGYLDSVYVKFDAKDLPSDPTHNYDAVFVGEYGEDHVHCTSLHTGNYYLYATAWDSINNERVYGGLAVKIKFSERQDEIDINIPVVE